jgi:hypothetical protein
MNTAFLPSGVYVDAAAVGFRIIQRSSHIIFDSSLEVAVIFKVRAVISLQRYV